MNYILHLNKTFEIICEDERLSPFHVSLYYSLFQFWNMVRFRNPISISRDEVMRASKIGSVNTYIRCIKELHEWKYIQYKPSFNPQKGSQVYLYNFDNSADKGRSKAVDKGTDKTSEMQVIPLINNTNKLNNSNSVNDKSSARKKLIIKKALSNEKIKKENFALSYRAKPKYENPTAESVANYFTEKQSTALEAEKFFNHYESNGWLVGGKTPMKNWQASARNWILNAEKYNHGSNSSKHNSTANAGKLNAKLNKNFDEPL